eukprot:TRINITY_DN17294_c0_g1_i1.p1 TRINITY_DN17294_c0_g1~~TRINITY_DN17294_c0_g1_i1.p1  ORF type:complete len:634 (+),score=82.96 TRINITY_DN17294_c0_g1_i1:69-1970(+)
MRERHLKAMEAQEGPCVAEVARDVERLVEKWRSDTATGHGHGHGQAHTSSHHKSKISSKNPKIEVEDCLNSTEATNNQHPQYQRKTPSPVKPGYTFGSPDREVGGKRYITPDQTRYDLQGEASPGPIYTPISFTDKPTKAQSFPRAIKARDKRDPTPGPQYDIPSALGKQLTRSSSPAYRMGQASRFNDSEFISQQHAKTTTLKDSPGPNAYTPGPLETSVSHSFASGGRDLAPGKIFVSKEHAMHDGIGMVSPGPRYAWDVTLIAPKAPAFSFGSHDHGKTPSEAGSDAGSSPKRVGRAISALEYGRDSPGPGTYAPTIKSTAKAAPAFSFGTTPIGIDLTNGVVSPGPQYLPGESQVRKTAPAAVFGDKDPLLGSMAVRFPEKQYLGPVIAASDNAGKFSPGPVYDGEKLKSAPAYSLGKREKILLKRICPSPERARFISKDLAKENLGAYSPGPKYSVPSTIGDSSSIKHSFGKSDRQFEDPQEIKEKLGTVAKPYTCPAEARYYSASLSKNHMLGKYSPGPKYAPDLSVVLPNAPKHAIAGKWKAPDPPTPTKEEYEEERQKSKQAKKDPTQKLAPAFKFATSKRGLLRGEDNKRLAVPGRDSPGPCYRPNFEAIDPKVKGGLPIGGLR